MKRSKFTDSQIINILKERELGKSAANICREYGISQSAFYKWCSKYGGMDVSLMKRLKEFESENRCLKKMYAEERLKLEIAKEFIGKFFYPLV